MDAKCIKFYEFGSPLNVLKVENKRIEPPNDHEVLVRMLARPINPSDLIPMRGSYSHRMSLPNIPGYEGVGIVKDVGASVSQSLIGKRVLPLRGKAHGKNMLRHRQNSQFLSLIVWIIIQLRKCISIRLQPGLCVQKCCN